MNTIETGCCIVGGGPAGMMLGLILARAGVPVTVLEKHGDFLRDFRGDTVQPSTLRILADLDLLERFGQLPVHREEQMYASLANGRFAVADFRGLKDFPYLALTPQWDFLNMLAEEGKRYPNYRLLMRTEGRESVEVGGQVVGVRATGPKGEIEVRADLVVGTDGRRSTMRAAAGFEPQELGAPMDCLWFRLSRHDGDREATGGVIGKGRMIVMLNRDSYWQIAYVIAKGGAQALRSRGIEAFRNQLATLAPFFADRVNEIRSVDELSLLTVQVDRLARWHRPGLLLIGDAAHAMSPVGGVGVNYAIQDAVAAANILGPILLAGRRPAETDLALVQKRREWPVRFMQRIQIAIQNRILVRAIAPASPGLRLGALPAPFPLRAPNSGPADGLWRTSRAGTFEFARDGAAGFRISRPRAVSGGGKFVLEFWELAASIGAAASMPARRPRMSRRLPAGLCARDGPEANMTLSLVRW